jgi:hypothetical protein
MLRKRKAPTTTTTTTSPVITKASRKKRRTIDPVQEEQRNQEEDEEEEEEEWRVVKGCDRYEVNCRGEIRNCETCRVLKPVMNEDGYLRQNLRNHWVYIHRAVAEQFVFNPKPRKYRVVHHKNGIRSDNRAENLEWTNVLGNNRRRRKRGPRPPPCKTPVSIKTAEWRTVEGCACEHYEVCGEGYIRLKRRPNQVLRPFPINGYAAVSLSTKTQGPKTFKFHLLLANVFLGSKPEGKNMIVNHKDKNKFNNHISNLEWITQQLNVVHGRGLTVCKCDATTHQVLQTFSTLREAAKDANISVHGIRHRILRQLHFNNTFWKFYNSP